MRTLLLLLIIVLAAPALVAEDDECEVLLPFVTLVQPPSLPDVAPTQVSQQRVDEITQLIDELSGLGSEDLGLLTMPPWGTVFLPVGEFDAFGKRSDHKVPAYAPLRKLVEIGPEALPLLLGELDNDTPTKVTINAVTSEGTYSSGLAFREVLHGNPANPAERFILNLNRSPFSAAIHPHGQFIVPHEMESYRIKVGDVCLVIVGQIVGRSYACLLDDGRKPTGTLVCSPVHRKKVCDKVRRIWKSSNPRQKVLESLLLDYSTRSLLQRDTLDHWHLGSDFQTEAVIRLLYYYPQETTALIAERLRTLDVNSTSAHGKGTPVTGAEFDAYMRREVVNGVAAGDFIQAVSWCSEPGVRAAVRDIFLRTDDIDILLAALTGIDNTERQLMMERLQHFLDAVPMQEHGAYGDGFNLLAAMAERLGVAAVPAFMSYLNDAGALRGYSVAKVLGAAKGEWCIPLLNGLLDDRRPVPGYTYSVHRKAQDLVLPIRVCDAAAEAITRHRPQLTFTLAGEYADLDKQVEAIRVRFAGEGQ